MRFRLLSYMAAMLLLAGVLGANLTSAICPRDFGWGHSFWAEAEQQYGWPFAAVSVGAYKPIIRWHWVGLSLDIAIGLAIPIAGLLTCEFAFRRWGRDRNKKACRPPEEKGNQSPINNAK